MTEEQKPEGDVLEELHSLGQQLATAVKSLWESEESRRLRQEIGEGFLELGRQVDTAIKSAQESETTQQFAEQVKETVHKARASDITAKLEEGLLIGLQELNKQVAKLVSSMEPSATAEEEPESEAAPEEPETAPEA